MKLQNQNGIALIISLMVMTILLILAGMFIARTVNEKNLADRERRMAKAFYMADGGAQAAVEHIDTLINTNLLNTVNATNPQKVSNKASAYVANGDGLGFLVEFVKNGNTAQFTLNGQTAVHNGTAVNVNGSTYQFTIFISEKSNPITVGLDQWDFPYYYQVQSTGTNGSVTRKVLLTGDFTVRVQRDNFAKFALFTDHHGLPAGGTVWFTDKTNFAGPIHTNERYSFALNPSGIFDGVVTQQNTKAQFYNNGSPIAVDADYNGTRDVPVFNQGYTRGATEIVLASSVQKQDLIDQAKGGASTTGNGIFVPNNGNSLVGGIYVKGNAAINMSVDANDRAVYQITQGSTTKTVTVDISNNETTVATAGGSTQTYAGLPDGVDDLGTIIYVDGEVSSLKGKVQKDTEVTVSSENDIVISDHLTYADYNPAVGTPGTAGYAPPNATDKANLFGIVSWGGDVRVGTTASDNINIHGIVMARNGVFSVDDYDDTGEGSRGTATLLGGAITQFYGAFGQFSSATGLQISGYGRNFVYDGRTLLGKSPPYFPSMKTFIAFTNDIIDKIAWQEGGF